MLLAAGFKDAASKIYEQSNYQDMGSCSIAAKQSLEFIKTNLKTIPPHIRIYIDKDLYFIDTQIQKYKHPMSLITLLKNLLHNHIEEISMDPYARCELSEFLDNRPFNQQEEKIAEQLIEELSEFKIDLSADLWSKMEGLKPGLLKNILEVYKNVILSKEHNVVQECHPLEKGVAGQPIIPPP
jgi:hypothetical protein